MTEAPSLSLFVVTFLFVSITPGLCMTLSLTLGIAIGVRKTLWMMAGELLGVGIVSTAAVVGVAAFMLEYPDLFRALTYAGAAYLFYVGWRMWQASETDLLVANADKSRSTGRGALALQGFLTAVANPKGWAFSLSLLPPFIDYNASLGQQLTVLLSLIIAIEFLCLLAYASGGQALRHYLQNSGAVQLVNRVAGSLIMLVGLWLALTQ